MVMRLLRCARNDGFSVNDGDWGDGYEVASLRSQ
jgi:hypothetical protein